MEGALSRGGGATKRKKSDDLSLFDRISRFGVVHKSIRDGSILSLTPSLPPLKNWNINKKNKPPFLRCKNGLKLLKIA